MNKWRGSKVQFDADGSIYCVQNEKLYSEFINKMEALLAFQNTHGITVNENFNRIKDIFQYLNETVHIWRYEKNSNFAKTVKNKINQLRDSITSVSDPELKTHIMDVLFKYDRSLEFKCISTILSGDPCSRDVSKHCRKFCSQHYKIKNNRKKTLSAAICILLHTTDIPMQLINIISNYCE